MRENFFLLIKISVPFLLHTAVPLVLRELPLYLEGILWEVLACCGFFTTLLH